VYSAGSGGLPTFGFKGGAVEDGDGFADFAERKESLLVGVFIGFILDVRAGNSPIELLVLVFGTTAPKIGQIFD